MKVLGNSSSNQIAIIIRYFCGLNCSYITSVTEYPGIQVPELTAIKFDTSLDAEISQ